MTDDDLTAEFETNRSHLRAVAYRMLGWVREADDALQEAWLRASRADTGDVENMRAWLTTVVARVSLNMLRARKSKREEPLAVHVPEPIVESHGGGDPEHEALLADSVGLALLVVLETLSPAERLAYVLHDMFSVPFEDIAPIVERSPAATRQLASRGRRRVEAEAPAPDPDLSRQREVVEAFMAASREGDFEGLVAVPASRRGAAGRPGTRRLAARAGGRGGGRPGAPVPALRALRAPGAGERRGRIVTASDEQAYSVLGFAVAEGKVLAIDILADPARLERLDLAAG